MRLAFWLSFSAVLYTYLGYPVVMWMLARIRPRQWAASSIHPSISIVLPVHNGQPFLRWKIDHLLHLDYANIKEIIIVSDGSTDGTAEILKNVRHPIVHPIILPDQVGKASALNAGVSLATAEIVLFVDIRPTIGRWAIEHLVSNFADPEVGCVSGELSLLDEGHDSTTSAIGGFYWRYEQWIRKCESAVDSPVGVYGGFYAARRTVLVNFPDGLILDDMFQPLSIIRQGFRSVVDASAKVYDTWPKRARGEFNRKVRTLAGNYQLFKVAPRLLAPGNRVLFQLVSHKLMRLIVPFLLVIMLTSSAALSFRSPLYAGLSLAQAVVWIAALLNFRFRLPLLGRLAAPACALLVLNTAAVVGLYRFFATRGPLWRIWNTGQFADISKVPRKHDAQHSSKTQPWTDHGGNPVSLNWESHDNVVDISQRVMDRWLQPNLEADYNSFRAKLLLRASELAQAAEEVVESNAIGSSLISLEAAINEWRKNANELSDFMGDVGRDMA